MPANSRPLSERELAIVGKYAAQHGAVRSFAQPIADDRGDISMPLVRIGTLLRLERRGVISPAEGAAGAEFHRIFQLAALDPLRAADVSRAPMQPGTEAHDLSSTNERCRKRISDILRLLGGAGSLTASAAWHVAGLEWPIARWALVARRDRGQATGILIGALSALAAHFASGRPARRA